MTETEVEDVALDMLRTLLEEDRRRVVDAVDQAVETLRRGEEPSEDDLGALRQAAEGLRFDVEKFGAELAEGEATSRLGEESVEIDVDVGAE